MQKIIIVGPGGSGKTTLGKILSKKLDIPDIDLDDLFWLPNWIQRPREEFITLIDQAVSRPAWIICGNQSKFHYIFWPKADTVIWLDLPLATVFFRALRRGLRQFKTKELICNGNHQTVRQFLWLLRWNLTSYHRRKKRYQALKEETPHLKWIHLKSQADVDEFVSKLV